MDILKKQKTIQICDLFFLNFTLIFSIGFFHFLCAYWLHTKIDNMLYIFFLVINVLLFIKLKKTNIKKEGFKIFIFFIFFILLLLYSINFEFLSYSIVYNLYILFEFIIFIYLFSNINFHDFKRIVLSYRNAYLITTIPLFLLYIIDILNIYNFPNSFIVFNQFRFGGFVSEPRGMAIFSVLALATILLVKRVKYQKLEISFVLIVIFSTFSNSIFLLLIIYPIIYYFFKINLKFKLLYIIITPVILYLIWIYLPSFSIGRFIVDKDSLSYIFNNISHIGDIDVGYVNALNVRLWIYLKGIMELQWYGLGFESATNISVLSGSAQSDAIGIITLLSDFGYIIGTLFIFYMLYLTDTYKKFNINIFKFLIILFILILMSPPYAKFYIPFYVYFYILYRKTKIELKQLRC